MKKYLQLLTVLCLGIIVGGIGAKVQGQSEEVKPVFLVISADLKADADAAAMAAYGEAAGPLARQAGNTTLAKGVPKVLEGQWPSESIIIKQYDSMAALLKFWDSDGYQKAKKHREGQLDVNFIVAIEAN